MTTFAPLYATVDEAAPAGGWPASWGAAEQAEAVLFASQYVTEAVRFDVYSVDPETSLPYDQDIAALFRQAVQLTVAGWARAGLEPWLAGTPAPVPTGVVTSMSGGGRSLGFAQETAEASAARLSASTSLSPSALMLLRHAGFGSHRVQAVRL